MPQEVKDIERDLVRIGKRGNIEDIMNTIGESIIVLANEVIKLRQKINIITGEQEDSNPRLRAKEKIEIEKMKSKDVNLKKRIDSLQRDVDSITKALNVGGAEN